MAKNEAVWFRNKLTKSVQCVAKGTPEHRRMITTVIEKDGSDEVFQVWEAIDAPDTSKSTTYKPGVQATVHKVDKEAGSVEAHASKSAPEAPVGKQGQQQSQPPSGKQE